MFVAFTDPESFMGYMLPSAVLAEQGQTPADYFKKIIYTASHDRSIMAVTTNVVDAGAGGLPDVAKIAEVSRRHGMTIATPSSSAGHYLNTCDAKSPTISNSPLGTA